MAVHKIDYNKVHALSSKDLAYINKEAFLRPFYNFENTIDGFQKAIQARASYPIDRSLLSAVIHDQYDGQYPNEKVKKNIDKLNDENTFTIITAHQPALLGGPLYYVLKIASVINLTRHLNAALPDHHFVPIFINGSEDHDFEEISHLQLYGKSIHWEREAKGSVGRLSTEGLEASINAAADILGNSPHAEEIIRIAKDALSKTMSYNPFVHQFVTQVFADYELVVANTDDQRLKRAFIPIIRQEITERKSKEIVEKTQRELDQNGFSKQAHARAINFFYIDEQGRNRIIYEDDTYGLHNHNKRWSEDEILHEIELHPDRFSPNVIMRPIYQEYIFPNLAYIGGGGEISYWLERKSLFEHYNVFYPMLIRRNSALILDGSHTKKLEQVNLSIEDIFEQEHVLINSFIEQATDVNIDLSEEKRAISKVWKAIAEKAGDIDPTLKKATLAEMNQQMKGITSIESRLHRKIKADQEVDINRIKKIKELLFPDHGLQERKTNFMQFYTRKGQDFIDLLVEHLDPLDNRFTIIKL